MAEVASMLAHSEIPAEFDVVLALAGLDPGTDPDATRIRLESCSVVAQCADHYRDQLALLKDIGRLIATYGPAVDSADADRAANLWATDGTYDVEGWRMASRSDTVTADTATAVCESLVLLRGDSPLPDSTFRVWRATADRFELERIDGKWLITTRTSRLLDGPGLTTRSAGRRRARRDRSRPRPPSGG